MSRGNSLAAAVVLIGILSTLAIGLQAASPQPQSSTQVAVAVQSQVAAADNITNHKRLCQGGFEYTVRVKAGDTKVTCDQKFLCSGANAEACDNKPDVKQPSKEEAARNEAACKKPVPQKYCGSDNDKSCISSMCDPTKADKVAESAAKEAASTLPNTLKDTEDTATLAELKQTQNSLAQNKGFNGIMQNSFADTRGEVAGEIGDVKDAKGDAQSTLDGLGKEEVKNAYCGDPNSSGCAVYNKNVKDLKTEIGVYDDRLKELDAQQNRLAAAATSLQPGNSPANNPTVDRGVPGGSRYVSGPVGRPNTTGFSSGYPGQQSPLGALNSLLGGGQGGQPPAGNRTPYAPGSCQFQYHCSGNTLYYRDSSCVDQPQQYCQFGCSANACSQNPALNPTTPATQPTATITSCTPKIADVGKNVSIAFSCTNAVSSTGTNFTTGGQLSGTVDTTVQKPPNGINTIDYGVTCTAQNGQTATAPVCQVEINQPLIVMVTVPAAVKANEKSSVAWVTRGMSSCAISSPDLPAFTEENKNIKNVNGTVPKTPALTQSTQFTLTCQTKGGEQRTETRTIQVQGGSGDTTS